MHLILNTMSLLVTAFVRSCRSGQGRAHLRTSTRNAASKALQRLVSQWFSVVALGIAPFSLSAYEYQISGIVKFEQFHEDGSTETEPDFQFDISVRDCRWFLRMVMQKTAGY